MAGKKIETFDAFRQMVQISVENIQSRALAGELDASEIAGTDIRMINYSYLNSKDKNGRYYVQHMTKKDKDEDIINEFRDFRKFKKFNSKYQNQNNGKFSSGRQPTENNQCYN